MERERLSLLVYFLSLHPRFVSLFYSSLKLEPGRETVMIVLICIFLSTISKEREILASLVYFSGLYPFFASLFCSGLRPNPGRDTVTLGQISNSFWLNNFVV